MNYLIKSLILLIMASLSNGALLANLYEGFDFDAKKNESLGLTKTLSGATSYGWTNGWKLGSGRALFSIEDISFDQLESTGGSVVIKGEKRNANFFGKGFATRQTNVAYEGEIYGSFRIVPGFMTEDTVVGMVFSLPNVAEMSVRNGLFAICPKRWGGPLGMVGAKGKTYKVVEGNPCLKGREYLVIWKMVDLPKMGDAADVSIEFWVLNTEQVDYFASKQFEDKFLSLAEPGDLKNQVSQYGRKDLKDTKRSLYKGIVMTPFVFNTNNVKFDEIKISTKGIKDAVGLK